MKNNLIVKSNKVVEAGYELTTNEQRLILLAIAKIPKDKEIDHLTGYEITAQEFAEAYNIHPKTAYRELKEAGSRLYERSIILKSEQQTMKVRWTNMLILNNPYFEDVLRDENWNRIVIGFSPQIIPYLSNIKANFTQYLQSDISNVSGAYTIRFYEFISQYRAVGKREITIADLRFMLNIGDKYPLFYDFKKRVIEPSIKEINEKTPMEISYELKKKGKTVVSILLKFKEKPKPNQDKNSRDPNTIDWVNGATDKESQLLTPKQADYFASKLAEDTGFGSKFGGNGENMNAFTSRISNELQRDISKVAGYMPYLLKAGYTKK